jgi:short-subunit dehydrogenase
VQEVLAADLAERADVERLAAASAHVDVLVANAALPASGLITETSTEAIDRALAVNLRAPIVLAQRLGAAMAARGSGHIVVVSSLSGKAGAPGTSLYAATKFGLRGFALSLREDLRPAGVGVSTVLPGFIRDAGMFANSGGRLPPYVGTKAPGDVAVAVIGAIEHDRAEVVVAPLGLRAGAALAGLLPETAARVQRRLGGAAIASTITRGQRD